MSKKLGLPEENIELQRNILDKNELNSALTTEDKTIVSGNPDNLTNGELADSQGKVWAIVSLSAALLAVSLAAIFIRLSEREIGPNATVFNRLWIATAVFGLWNGAGEARRRMSGDEVEVRSTYTLRDFILLTAVGVVSSASLGLWAWSLTQTNVANSTVLRNLTPLFTTLGGWLLLGRRFDSRFLVGLAVALGGAIAIGTKDLQIAGDNFAGDIAALLSAMFYAGNLLIAEHLRAKFPATTILMWRCFIGSILILPLVVLAGDRVFPYSWQGWLAVIALAVICQAFGQGLLIHSLGRLSSGFVALFLLLEPVITAILAWLLFAESLSLFNWFALAVVLAGIYLAKSSSSTDKK
ncbi:MAG: DMT family transporter [Microcoleus sp. PH2017_10_PVI_O_A]|uniref:DMT family transporter n=1 Tax=unclassified Microcoleus TaxID=2642155 RepID=UPI001D779DF3|nr:MULTISPECIES: DMT family transporter [unclassified Microcoleus]TAE79474.1 MAG: EamA family transporter [Oscillatoriales cyanobacterium]MCC3408228.1 DMT family transporter [Microcoleus sp. PH2017_10_PVI_O_A]MCC3462322.1 DMT family transporter [Microcoleus sp. PH2017_11_PCY_U_A]MCC3480773.1 DMT family transporter [Microcoleus sp. PH2017_12_PCY_D_A]MCC3530699.1 DMT family transporter [Microcoleus sp. PH2017_21_RUC_O_A]